MREYDPRTGRPLIGGCDAIERLTDAELDVEMTIAAMEPTTHRRAHRLTELLLERKRREGAAVPGRR